MTNKIKNDLRLRRSHRVRTVIKGGEKPRLSVFFSLLHSYAQIIDDAKGITIVSASDKELKKKGMLKDLDVKPNFIRERKIEERFGGK